MRIGIDARLILYRRGMGTFVYNLLAAIAGVTGDYSIILYVDDARAAEFVPQDQRFVVKVLAPKIYPLWEQISLPLAVARDRIAILHCAANTAPMRLPSGVKLVLTIHDVMYMLPNSVLPSSPSLYQRLGRQYRRWVVPPASRRANVIVTDSHHSSRDIETYLGAGKDKLKVIYGAPNAACRLITDATILNIVRGRYGLKSPFFLALAAVDPRKNTARIIEAYAKFRQMKTGDYQLLLVGLTPANQTPFRQLVQRLGVADEVVLAGFVSEEDLVALYNAAEVLVYPSLYEGFGLPVLEAMACGTPVITSPTGSLPEVAGDAALMVNPLEVGEIANAMQRVTRDSTLAQDLIKKGHEQVKKFSWRQAAMETLRVYESLR